MLKEDKPFLQKNHRLSSQEIHKSARKNRTPRTFERPVGSRTLELGFPNTLHEVSHAGAKKSTVTGLLSLLVYEDALSHPDFSSNPHIRYIRTGV
jgi:hypothetical protein